MSVRILTGDCRELLATLPVESVHCVVTSVPYWRQRDYGMDAQIGMARNRILDDAPMFADVTPATNSPTAATPGSQPEPDQTP